MVPPPATYAVPFDGLRKIPGSLVAHEAVVALVHQHLGQAYTEQSHEDLIDDMDSVPVAVNLDADEGVEFLAMWQENLRLLPRASEQGLDQISLPSTFHPLLAHALRNPTGLEDHRAEWFVKNGARRHKRSSSVTSRPSSSSGAQDQSTADEEEFTDWSGIESGADGEGTIVAEAGGSSRAKAKAGGITVGSILKGPPPATLPRRPNPIMHATISASERHKINAAARAKRLAAEWEQIANEPDDASDDEKEEAVVSESTADYYLKVQARIVSRNSHRRGPILPPHSVALRMGTLLRKLKHSNKAQRPLLVAGWQAIAAECPVTLADIQKIALNEFVDLISIRNFAPASSHDVDEGLLDVLSLQQLKKKPGSDAPLDPLVWGKYFRIFIDVYLLVHCDIDFEQERTQEIEAYHDYIMEELERTSSASVRARIILYDAEVRKEILLPHGRIRHLGDASTRDVLFQTIVTAPNLEYSGVSDVSRNRQRSPTLARQASAHSYDVSSSICGRWNNGIDCGKQCGREHACLECNSAEHPALRCPRRSGAGNAGKRVRNGDRGAGGGRKKGGAVGGSQ